MSRRATLCGLQKAENSSILSIPAGGLRTLIRMRFDRQQRLRRQWMMQTPDICLRIGRAELGMAALPKNFILPKLAERRTPKLQQ